MQRLHSIPKANYTESFLRFLQKLCLCCVRAHPAKAFGLAKSVFWEIISIEQPAELSDELCRLSLLLLSDLLVQRDFETQRIPYVELCAKSVDPRVPNAALVPLVPILALLQTVLATFPSKSDPSVWNRPQLIKTIDTTMKMQEYLFAQLRLYHQHATPIAKEAAAAMAPPSPSSPSTTDAGSLSPAAPSLPSDFKVGRFLHSAHVHARLDFLFYALDQSPELVLSNENVESLWRLLFTDALCSSDRTQLGRWLERLIDDGSARASGASTCRNYAFCCLSDQGARIVFKLISAHCVAHPAQVSHEMWLCFELYFCWCNFKQGCLAQPARKYVQVLTLDSLHGLDALWTLTATLTDANIFRMCRSLLVSLYTKLDAKVTHNVHTCAQTTEHKEIMDQQTHVCLAIHSGCLNAD
jgi:hypothetical protein